MVADTSELNALITTGDLLNPQYYTASTWSAYATALANAKAVAAKEIVTQAEVDAAAAALDAAYQALEAKTDPVETVLTAELLNGTVPMGKQVGIRVISEASVTSLTITCGNQTEEPISCFSQSQFLSNGDYVTVWLVFLDADTAGTFTYTINGTTSVTVNVVDTNA